VHRGRELAFLDGLLARDQPSPASLTLVYGRRRVGKTTLLKHWVAAHAQQAGYTHTYWTAEKESAGLQRRKLLAALAGLDPANAAGLTWSAVWKTAAGMLAGRRHVMILDELQYAAESDPAMLSTLQHAWDEHFQDSQTGIILCGSHVRTMEALMSLQSPLFGRMTGQWRLLPLPFAALREFFPGWSAEERVVAYAMVGGIPAYLRWLKPNLSLVENIQQVMLDPGSMFLTETMFLLYDEVREPGNYLSVLKAIGNGHHTLEDIANDSLIGKTHLSFYLSRLQELKLIERRVPVALPPSERRVSRRGRYHLVDAYFRFYFRFIAPFQGDLSHNTDPVLAQIRMNLRAFVGQTSFEELAREWVRQAGHRGALPLKPNEIGSHWNWQAQADVVAVEWARKQVLIGECKWGDDEIGRQVAQDLIERKAPMVLRDLPDGGAGWTAHLALFGRRGFTRAAQDEMRSRGGLLIDLERLDSELREE
jgi:AAA+ ATPase superfamily predicted ATPase